MKMKLFSWMQNKLNGNGKQGNHMKPNTVPITHNRKQEFREEFSDWPNGLLAIGTFGNNDLRQNHEIQDVQVDQAAEEAPSFSDELQDFPPEEIGKLQKELTKLLSRKPISDSKEKEAANLPLDRFLNCPSSLEVDRRISNGVCSDVEGREEDDIEKTISVILGWCKDISEKNKKKGIGKKSITFLLKKMFVCRSGFAPQPSLRDTFQESRMEKLLRTLLHKKINTQNASRASSMKKYIEDKRTSNNEEKEDEKRHKTNDGSKWVKTDSEYIVLEI